MKAGAVAEVLRQKSEGNFLYVTQALEGIEQGSYRLDRLDELPPGLNGLYEAFFESQVAVAPRGEQVRG